jgi:hypothetical protein
MTQTVSGFKHYATLPGRVISMSTSGENLFVLCEVERKWWQFWKPKIYLVTLEFPK